MHIEMNSIWRWLYNVAGRDFGGTTAAPNDGVFSPDFFSRQHGMSTGVEYFSASFGNDAYDLWIACKWTDEESETSCVVMAAEDFRKIALWYLWRWAWGEWFGLRRRLWYAALRRICARRD